MVSQHGSRVKRRAARAARLLRKSAFIPMSAIAERSGILRIPHLTVNGIGLNVEVAGAGPPLLLLHGFTGDSERSARRASDEALAATTERDGVQAFVAHWEQLPLFASQNTLPAAARSALRRQRLHNSAQGLAHSLRGMGTGAQASLWSR